VRSLLNNSVISGIPKESVLGPLLFISTKTLEVWTVDVIEVITSTAQWSTRRNQMILAVLDVSLNNGDKTSKVFYTPFAERIGEVFILLYVFYPPFAC